MTPVPTPASEPTLPTAGRGTVVFHRCDEAGRGHDQRTKLALAESLAALLGWTLVDGVGAAPPGADARIVVPTDTLVGRGEAERLGIQGPQQVFGGVVPHPFVATKVITHPLVHAAAQAPEGWSAEFPALVAGVVLPGLTAFTANDAIEAGKRLLAGGTVRIKEPGGIGGAGQSVAHDLAQLKHAVLALDAEALVGEGVVIERHVNDVKTLSVGQVAVGPWLVSYCGTQRLTRNRHGAQVYGGSQLEVVRGGFDALLAEPLTDSQRLAVEQALVYHRAALDCFDGLIASRANYDVAQGIDDAGRPLSGVLEQSWRVGGASAAELAALHAFKNDPALQRVGAATHEVHGGGARVPAGAWVSFDGVDAKLGRLTKFATLERGVTGHVDA